MNHSVEVPGLAEKRPSVLLGLLHDLHRTIHIVLMKQSQGIAYWCNPMVHHQDFGMKATCMSSTKKKLDSNSTSFSKHLKHITYASNLAGSL